MKKWIMLSLILLIGGFVAGCCSSASKDETKVKIGVSGSDNRIWDFVAKKAKKEGIDIEIVRTYHRYSS